MNFTIIDQKDLGTKKWYLCKSNLKDYISSLDEDMFNYEIQRGIVTNKYLDGILSTIKLKEPLPLITLTSKDGVDISGNNLSLSSFDILDGLQRTYRLWLYNRVFQVSQEIAVPNLFEDSVIDSKALLQKLKEYDLLSPGILSVSQVRYLLNPNSEVNIKEIDKMYLDYDIYFNIWTDLDSNEVIKKMLILNAGQKSVTVDHQYELMYLHLFKDKDFDVKLVRYKDSEYQLIKNGNRTIGEYLFSSIIISLRSFIEGKPQRLSIDYLSPSELEAQLSISVAEKYFSEEFIRNYLNQIKSLEEIIYNREREAALKWFVKDTTMSGILAAIGKSMPNDVENTSTETLIEQTNIYFGKLKHQLNTKSFCINEFFKEYDNLSSTRINIGDTVRKMIFNYTLNIIEGNDITWSEVFKSYSK